jgi:hypothetical protein
LNPRENYEETCGRLATGLDLGKLNSMTHERHSRKQRHVFTSDRAASCRSVATALTDAVYVLFTNAVVKRRRLPAATWSSVWYLLSSFAVISYSNEWVYVLFAATGSFIGAYVTMTYLHPGPVYPPPPVGSAPG